MKLTVPVPPSANDWHRVVNGRAILSRAARIYTKGLHEFLATQGVHKIAAPTDIEVSIVWFRGRKAGDVDKRGAILLDALQGSCYDTDAQVRKYSIERNDTDSKNPRMELTITQAQERKT